MKKHHHSIFIEKTAMQFINTNNVTNFITALEKVDEKIALNLKEELDETFYDLIEVEKILINDIPYIVKTYETINGAYYKLYETGTTKAFIKLLNKCGSLSYVIDLIDDYIFELGSKNNQTLLIDEKFLKTICIDSEYHNEFAAIHLGLFNLIPLLYPCDKYDCYRFTSMDILPLDKNDILTGLKFVFKFKGNPDEDNEYYADFEISFQNLRRCIVAQAVPCMYKAYKDNGKLLYCKFDNKNSNIKDYDLNKALEHWESAKK